jgi:hypothetical protein
MENSMLVTHYTDTKGNLKENWDPVNMKKFVSLIMPIIDYLNLYYALRCCETSVDPRRFLRWNSACCPPVESAFLSYLPGELEVAGKPASMGIWDDVQVAKPAGKPAVSTPASDSLPAASASSTAGAQPAAGKPASAEPSDPVAGTPAPEKPP